LKVQEYDEKDDYNGVYQGEYEDYTEKERKKAIKGEEFQEDL
jgi:penicillin-binding protein-related factor A (putative recombinase)